MTKELDKKIKESAKTHTQVKIAFITISITCCVIWGIDTGESLWFMLASIWAYQGLNLEHKE